MKEKVIRIKAKDYSSYRAVAFYFAFMGPFQATLYPEQKTVVVADFEDDDFEDDDFKPLREGIEKGFLTVEEVECDSIEDALDGREALDPGTLWNLLVGAAYRIEELEGK